jgi:hypothetical protein
MGVYFGLDMNGYGLRDIAQGLFVNFQSNCLAVIANAKPQFSMPMFIENGGNRTQSSCKLSQAFLEFYGFRFFHLFPFKTIFPIWEKWWITTAS